MAIKLTAHHNCAQLKKRYPSCADPVEKTHWWIIWKIAQAQEPMSGIAQEAGVGRQWVYKLKDRYNLLGQEGLKDRRSDNGAKPLLNQEALEALRLALSQPPQDSGLWSGPKVARWMEELLQRPVLPQVGWQYLKKLKWAWKVPRPRHAGSATDQEKTAYKKTRRRSGGAGPKQFRKKSRAVG
ncbi:MAG: helix-turn-helix domain-containing protein [Blastochloris sp.]|nr:helix-turn-helix domain-containing protein [Blastochloris sp.]